MNLDEITRLEIILEDQETDIPASVQGGEYHIKLNDGTSAVGFTIGSDQIPMILSFCKTKHYMVVCIAESKVDDGRCEKEVLWISDHIRNEGY